ncbi:hypothetical protein QUA27_26625 [Microcoleus sp. Pol14C6]|uniref:hypothetical protein n=1 Tax=unclassified Microcoleus TaxID=2642155 RepID=UPI002FD55518
MNSSGNSFTGGCSGGCLTILIGAIVWAIVNSILVVLLWNWLMPDLFGFSTISIFQAIGISFLLGLLRSSSDNSSGD